jgi:hypothetical protein
LRKGVNRKSHHLGMPAVWGNCSREKS